MYNIHLAFQANNTDKRKKLRWQSFYNFVIRCQKHVVVFRKASDETFQVLFCPILSANTSEAVQQ